MKIDLHIHSTCSDGEINYSSLQPLFFKDYSLISFTDHEYIFNPSIIQSNGKTKFISGVEICCNHQGNNVEILGYNFDTNNLSINKLVEKIRNNRRNIISKILLDNGISTEKLSQNPFRKNVILPSNINPSVFWRNNTDKYKKAYHSTPANEVIQTIRNANGIPVLAHPMESLQIKDKKTLERIILSLEINCIELITPKHNSEDIEILKNIIIKNNLHATIGSDSHGLDLVPSSYHYTLQESYFMWLQQFS